MTVVPPFDSRLITEKRSLTLEQGESATLNLKEERIPVDAVFRLANAPEGVTHQVTGRQPGQVAVQFQAAPDASPGRFDVSLEARVGDRWATSDVITLSVQKTRVNKASN
jgi:hypothetical protein